MFLLHTRPSSELKEGGVDIKFSLVSPLAFELLTGTKCNSLIQQFIGISTTIDTWATCFGSYRVIFTPSKNTDPIFKVVKCTVGSPMLTW